VKRAWLLPLALLVGCENDVQVRLLPKPLAIEPVAGQAGQMGQAGQTSEPMPPCNDGDPCSGLARALYFQGPYDRVEIASSALLDVPQDFTFEAWVLPKSYQGGHGVINRWAAGVADIQLTFGTPEPLPQLELPTSEPVPSHLLASWAFVRPELWLTVMSPNQPYTGAWHHLAVAYGSGSYRLYLDGALQGSAPSLEAIPNADSTLYIGATARNERGYRGEQGDLWWPPIDGFIAEVRLSSVSRYSPDFTPPPRLSSDASTIALWHLDEGEGNRAADSGPSSLDGTITGASWVYAPERRP
jgi:hypothetical protein